MITHYLFACIFFLIACTVAAFFDNMELTRMFGSMASALAFAAAAAIFIKEL